MKYKQNNNTISANLDNEIILLNLLTGKYILLNNSGMEIWKLLKKPLTIKNIHEELSKKFSFKDNDVEKDIQKFLENAKKESLIDEIP